MVAYLSFYEFLKNQNFAPNSYALAYGLSEKSPVCRKDLSKLHISWLLPHYSGSVIHNSSVYEFLWLSKILIFTQNPYLLAYGFNKNHHFAAKTDRNYVFLGRDPHILDRLYIMVSYMSFYMFLKNFKFLLKIHRS
jgi:hypothetical protein